MIASAPPQNARKDLTLAGLFRAARMIASAPINPAIPGPRAYYEGANGSKMRQHLPGVVQNARKDLTRSTRRELMRNSRSLWKNNALIRGVVERFVTYTCGTGIRPEPASSNPEWNRRAAVVFEEWAKYADLSSRQSFWKLQEIALRSLLIDGDVFCVLTYSESGRPRIQLVEGDQVGSPNQLIKNRDDDGVVCDKNGRPVEYIFQEPTDVHGYAIRERRISADNVVHLGNFNRPGQQRGEPMAAAALTTAIDLHDILGLEKAAVKDTSTRTDIIKTASGEINADDLIGSEPGEESPDSEAQRFYEKVFGPESKVLRHGDEYTPYEPKRPGPAWQGFVDFLAELICLSWNLPPSLVRQIKSGSVDNRRDLATIQRVAEVWQWAMAQNWQRVYEYVIAAEIEDGSLGGAPADWRKTEWMFPRAPTVDAGRQAAQDREDVRSGNMTLREMCGQYGASWRSHVAQLADELRVVLDAEKKYGLPVGVLANRIYGQQGAPLLVDPVQAAKSMAEAYGIGVRAGVLTPNLEDEEVMRAKFALGKASKAVTDSWDRDGGVRTPITLSSQNQKEADVDAVEPETEGERDADSPAPKKDA